jgi:hypothetical protein
MSGARTRKMNKNGDILIVLVVTFLAILIVLIGFAILFESYMPVEIPIPLYNNATFAHAWVETTHGVLIVDTHDPEPLPFNLTFSTQYDTVTLRVDYYVFVQYGVGVSQTEFLAHEDYNVNVTQLQNEVRSR